MNNEQILELVSGGNAQSIKGIVIFLLILHVHGYIGFLLTTYVSAPYDWSGRCERTCSQIEQTPELICIDSPDISLFWPLCKRSVNMLITCCADAITVQTNSSIATIVEFTKQGDSGSLEVQLDPNTWNWPAKDRVKRIMYENYFAENHSSQHQISTKRAIGVHHKLAANWTDIDATVDGRTALQYECKRRDMHREKLCSTQTSTWGTMTS